ncbi:ATP-binding response regulator [Methylocella tundrae]|uniref:histidine kinase n=1 Tax=Methylocella tundrae TaxID=227605 RepID=A0A4U8Z2J4_METTU|nr:hybrid sensor histidine kinase/response regulator [Methylocella tundrae]WPP03460.1 hybrid sensor histidine kinase/response regulator [Methylocella tundrae]VFU09547.1 Histidine kinase [Methylocella tundrae]
MTQIDIGRDNRDARLSPESEADRLRAEIAKLRKINNVLMDRVENDMSAKGANAFTLFQAAITLENRVVERTAELTHLTHQLFQQISERCAAEKALLLAKGEAEKANLSKTRFLAAASHDLHQPLNVARLFLGMLAEHIETPHGRELVGGVEAALDTVDELLRALLDISRLDAGVWPVEITTFRIQPLLDRLRQDYQPQAEAVGLCLRVAPSSAVIRSDRLLLERVLRNFVSNALRYTAQGSILIGCRRRGEDVAIEVLDTGIGIASTHLELIFEEFKQLGASARENERGLGLGLAISQRIARLIDAKIAVASTPGRGSAFTISAKAGAGPTAAEDEKRQIDPAALAGRCVVLIDNDMQVRNALGSLLRSWQCVTITARSAADASEALRAARKIPHIIIADYHLDGDALGTDAVAALRAEFGEDAGALIISSDVREELKRSLKEKGLSFLAKPTAPMKLRAMLSALAARRDQLR